MKEDTFIQKNSATWHKVEDYNKKLANRDISALSADDIREYAELYRRAGLQLAYARTHYPRSRTTAYLNQLMGVSHNRFYTKERSSLNDAAAYITRTFPRHFRRYAGYFAAAALVFAAGALLCCLLAISDEKYLYFFLPKNQLQGIDLSTVERAVDYPLMSSFVMINNIRVSFLAYAWGFFGGIGTLFVLFLNGAMMGALTGYVVSSGSAVANFFALILPHGFIELAAIFISGAAGLIMGKHLLTPGRMTRKHSFIKGAKEAAVFMPGVALMLVLAGLIEGFFTPLGIAAPIKLAFAAVTLICLTVYFGFAGRT